MESKARLRGLDLVMPDYFLKLHKPRAMGAKPACAGCHDLARWLKTIKYQVWHTPSPAPCDLSLPKGRRAGGGASPEPVEGDAPLAVYLKKY